ncbi:MAG: SBBP repeat-containing protein [Bacteroidia bacterium]
MKTIHIYLLIFLFFTKAFGINKNDINLNNSFFIENKGQWSDNILYCAKLKSQNVWFTSNGIYYDFYKITTSENKKLSKHGHVIKLNYGNNSINHSDIKGVDKLNTYQNYFIGNPTNWATNVGLFKEIIIENIFNGIDQRWYFENDKLRYDYIIHPHNDYKKIKLIFEGINEKNIYIKQNELILNTRFGEVKNADLLVYQIIEDKKIIIPAKWIKKGENYSIELLSKYNENYPLIIDPLIWSTFLGGDGFETINDLYVSNTGDIYVTGYTLSYNFPTTIGTYDNSYEDYHDAFISKLSSSGNTLLYSTFLGGNKNDYGIGITVDGTGKIYVSGDTESSNFPVSANAYDQTLNGNLTTDVFVTKFNSSGNLIEFSTYIGGAFDDHVAGIKIDNNSNIYIAGSTISSDFPTTSLAYDNTHNLNNDIFVTKLNNTGSSLLFSTFLGGSNHDYCYSFTLDNYNNIYITGNTSSSNYPKTNGVFSTNQNLADICVSKISNDGSNLLLSTVLGGNNYDYAYSISVDVGYRVSVAGSTLSTDFPTTQGAFMNSHQGYTDGFIFRLNSNFTVLDYSTYIGGNDNDEIISIYKTASNEFVVVGHTKSNNFPITTNAHQYNKMGGIDVFITKFLPDLSDINYSSYFGGSGNDYGEKLFFNNLDNTLIFCGKTYSSNFPVTSGAYDVTFNNSNESDAFITKLYLCPFISFTPSSNSPVCMGDSVYLNCGVSQTGFTYYWHKATFPIFSSTQCNPSFVANILNSGTYTITVTNTNNNCVYKDSIIVSTQLPPDTSVTINSSNVLIANQNGASYQWLDCNNGFTPIPNATFQTFTPTVNGSYAVQITLGPCVRTSNCYNISTIGIDDIITNEIIKIYPNPAKEALTIEVSENSKLEVYAYDGKLVAQENIANRTVLNVSNFNNGIYFVRLTNEAGETYQTKFMKQ